MFREDWKQLLKHFGGIESKPGLDGKPTRDGLAQGSENRIDFFWLTQQTATCAFAVNDGSRATEIQVDGRNIVLLQLLRAAYEGGNIVANHLGDGRSPGWILRDGSKDGPFQVGSGVDPEILRVINVWPAIAAHQPPKWEVGHILHWGQCQ